MKSRGFVRTEPGFNTATQAQLCQPPAASMTTKTHIQRTVLAWVPLAVSITLLTGFTYTVGQQVLRQLANDVPRALATEAAAELSSGTAPALVVPEKTIDIATSLSPVVMVFNENGTLLASSARLGDQLPVPPAGTFNNARSTGSDSFTWQPQVNVRSATVLLHYNSGFVFAGQSLAQTEIHEASLLNLAVVAWAVVVVTSFVAQLFVERRR